MANDTGLDRRQVGFRGHAAKESNPSGSLPACQRHGRRTGAASCRRMGHAARFEGWCQWLHMPQQACNSWIDDTSQPAAYCLSYFICVALHTALWIATYMADLSMLSQRRRAIVRTMVWVSAATDVFQVAGLFFMGPMVCRCAFYLRLTLSATQCASMLAAHTKPHCQAKVARCTSRMSPDVSKARCLQGVIVSLPDQQLAIHISLKAACSGHSSDLCISGAQLPHAIFVANSERTQSCPGCLNLLKQPHSTRDHRVQTTCLQCGAAGSTRVSSAPQPWVSFSPAGATLSPQCCFPTKLTCPFSTAWAILRRW